MREALRIGRERGPGKGRDQSLYTSDELAAIQRRLIISITPDEAPAFGPIMLAAANARERLQMLAAQKRGNAPEG